MANYLPPPPTNDATGSFAWLEWFRQLRLYITQTGSVPWSIINFSGSNITDLASRSHQNLQSLQGGSTSQYYHLTQNKHEELNNTITSVTTATATLNGTNTKVIVNYAGTCTLTLPTASSYTGRSILIKTITANAVNSNASNVVPLNSGTAGTAILAATAGKWAELVSDGTNWIIMAGA